MLQNLSLCLTVVLEYIYIIEGGSTIDTIRPLFIDFLFFITARMYFCCLTYFPIITDLTIITLNDIYMCMYSLVFQDGTCNTIPRALYKRQVFGKLENLCC